MRSFVIVFALIAVAAADVSELLAKSELTTIIGADGYNYPVPDNTPPRGQVIVDPVETVDTPVLEPGCANGGLLPHCCDNGADNADCCVNGGAGAFCCTNGADNAECSVPSVEYLPPPNEYLPPARK